MTIKYLDFVNGVDANDGLSFANRKKTLTSAATGLTGNDTVRIMSSPAVTSLGQSATWTNASDTVTLTTAVTANIHTCETNWTAVGANATCTVSNGVVREGTNALQISVLAAFTTGLALYSATGTLDLSAYQQVSFSFRTASTNFAAGVMSLALCSDVAGATPVNTIPIPASAGGYWHVYTVDLGTNLGSAIQSVAFYINTDLGGSTVNLTLDNIIACKAASAADSLSLTSLISLNTDSYTPWHTIRSINGTTVKLGCGDASAATPSAHTGAYFGTTATATTYKREPIMLTAGQTNSVAGSAPDSPLNIEGGWNTTDMSTQTDITWVRSLLPNQACINSTGNYCRVHKLYVSCGQTYGLTLSGTYSTVDEIGAAGCATGVNMSSTTYWRIGDLRYVTGTVTGVNLPNAPGKDTVIRARKLWGVGTNAGLQASGISTASSTTGNSRWQVDEIRNWWAGLNLSGPLAVAMYGCVFSNNTTDCSAGTVPRYEFTNCTMTPTAGRTYHTKHGQTVDDHRIYWDDTGRSTIFSATDQRHTASDFSWKFSPKSTTSIICSYTPLALSVAKVACPANEARTVSLWFRRDSTSLNMRLRIPGGQLLGVLNDVSTLASAAINTWEQLSVTFTPTEAGVIEVFAEAWGGTTLNGWVDDLSIT